MTSPLALLQRLNSHDLGASAAIVLLKCAEREHGMGELAKEAGISGSATTQTVDRLESRNLVKRTSRRDDARSILVAITEQGKIVAGRVLGE